MLDKLKKEIKSDFKEVDLDFKAPIFCSTVRDLANRSNLSNNDKKEIYEHLKRYEKASNKDFNLRFPRLFDNMMHYADRRGSNWGNDFVDDINMIVRIDAYSVKHDYGDKALSVYLGLSDKKQIEFSNKLSSIANANLSPKEIDRRKTKFIDIYYNNLFRKKR